MVLPVHRQFVHSLVDENMTQRAFVGAGLPVRALTLS
jgi:hypothetical protein